MLFVQYLADSYELLRAPWHWSVSGLAIAGILFLMTWLGRSFGVSAAFGNLCAAAGAGKWYDEFRIDVKGESWHFAFIFGAVFGGFLAGYLFNNPEAVAIAESTVSHLRQDFGVSYPQGNGFLPTEIFNFSNPKGVLLTVVGGFLVGFGARYGRGCTSGHAITGLAHLQLPSLLTVAGFFIGGLVMTWLLMPLLF